MIFAVLITLVLLETCLRLGGFVILSLQEHRNKLSIRQKDAYRILCLGESTTRGQWPPHLQEILDQHNIGIKFSVIDKGIIGSNTPAILSQVEPYLDRYHPDMVVAMIGINDWGEHIPYERPTLSKTMLFIKPFRTYKLARLLWLHMAAKAKEIGLYKLPGDKSPAQERQPSPLNMRLRKTNVQQEDNIKNEDAYKKALELNPGSEVASTLYGALGTVYREMGQFTLAEECSSKANQTRLNGYNPTTASNYHKLKEILDKRKIKLVCVQYPMLNIEPLKKIFQGNIDGVLFVDNEKTFKEAVKKGSYKMYFIDMFGGDFGHCTKKGNRLLAENIANVILKEYFKK
ncbi:MAG: GDSL-type esterase/lipase family protein [Candidatus Omnitrophota bacterium]